MNKSCLFPLFKKCELLPCVDLETVNKKQSNNSLFLLLFFSDFELVGRKSKTIYLFCSLFKDYLIFILILLVHKEREGFYVWENINKRFKKKKRNKYNLAYIYDSCSYVCGK